MAPAIARVDAITRKLARPHRRNAINFSPLNCSVIYRVLQASVGIVNRLVTSIICLFQVYDEGEGHFPPAPLVSSPIKADSSCSIHSSVITGRPFSNESITVFEKATVRSFCWASCVTCQLVRPIAVTAE